MEDGLLKFKFIMYCPNKELYYFFSTFLVTLLTLHTYVLISGYVYKLLYFAELYVNNVQYNS